MTIYKVLKYLAAIVAVIGAILLGRILMTGDDPITTSASVQASVVDPFMYVAYFIFVAVVLLVLFFVLKGLFKGNIKNALMSIGAFAAVILVAYLLADGGAMYDNNDVQTISDSGSKWVGTGLITFYILAIVAIGSMLISGVKKMMK